MEGQSGRDHGTVHVPPRRKRSGTRLRDDELRVMAAIARVLGAVESPARDAIVAVVMQPLTEKELRALRTVLRLVGTLDLVTAERTRRWVYDRFAQPPPPEHPNPTEEPWR
jgi:hypothetical protein